MNLNDLYWLLRPLTALGIGLLIGSEREVDRSGADSSTTPAPHAKGARTFALIALLGYGAALAGERFPGLPLWALLSLAVLLGALHLRRGHPPLEEDVTTEVASLITFLLGLLTQLHLQAAVTLSLLCTGILLAKPWVRGFIRKLRRGELIGTLQLLIAALIILPVAPNRPLQLPWVLSGVINPRHVVLFVVLIAAVGYVGYVLTRILGPQRGLAITGAVGGLTSSTAVTLAMGEQSKDPKLLGPAVLAAVLACLVMMARVLVLSMVLYPPVGLALLWPGLGMGAGYLVYSAALLRLRREPTPAGDRLALENPFALGPAFKFGLFFIFVQLLSRVAHSYLGARGLYLASAVAGLADVDAVLLNTVRMAQQQVEPLDVAATVIMLALFSNTLVKGGLAFTSGGRAFGLRVLLGHGVALAGGGLGLLWLRLLR